MEEKKEHNQSFQNDEPKMVEVFLAEPGTGRPGWSYKAGVLELLPANAPLPQVGDVILLPRNLTGDSDEQAFVALGALTPFLVVGREFMYFRGPNEILDELKPTPAQHSKTWIHVRRLTQAEYSQDPATLKTGTNTHA